VFGLLILGALIYLICVMEFAVRGRGRRRRSTRQRAWS
jgi:hypothetical protein